MPHCTMHAVLVTIQTSTDWLDLHFMTQFMSSQATRLFVMSRSWLSWVLLEHPDG